MLLKPSSSSLPRVSNLLGILQHNLHCNLPKDDVLMSCLITAERSSSGLLEFDSITDALDALMVCNHAPIQNPSKYTKHNCGSIMN
jgi:hypothetical protein